MHLLMTSTVHSNKFKLIILDECDAMTKDAQFALRRGALLCCCLCSGCNSARCVHPSARHRHNSLAREKCSPLGVPVLRLT